MLEKISWFRKNKPIVKPFRPDWWYRSRGYSKCILCDDWVKHSNIGFVHPVCRSCQDSNPQDSFIKDNTS